MKAPDVNIENSEISIKKKKIKATKDFQNNLEEDAKMNKKRKKKRRNDQNEEATKPEKKLKLEENTKTEHFNIENIKNDNSDASDNENLQESQVTKEESNKFNGKFLRNSFKSADGFSTLQKFITICNQNSEKDLAAEYLQAGGSVLEILRLLDTSEKKNINNASTVFTAMHIIIMKILAQYPQYQSNAQEACRHLINTHLAAIHSMLSSQSKAKHRKVVFKLLAALVSLGGTLPRELLNHLSLHAELLDVLVSHANPCDQESVRTCFIHFVLAFLIEGNSSDIRALLEKRGVLSSIFSGLIYDYSKVVQLVLTTVKKYVLENPSITKTTKLHVFSTPVVQGLVNLYNWKGPKNWPGYNKKQKSVTEHIDPEEKEITVNAVHEFLIVLLTSNRHGIAFHDRSLGTDSGRRNNQLINTILQSLDKPWEHKKPSDLIIKVLTACPDLIKSQLLYAEPYLVPRVSKKWIALMQFITKVINNINVNSCLKLCPADMTITQLSNAVLNLILPPIVIKNAIIPSLEQNNLLVHYEVINLTFAMIKKAQQFILEFEIIKSNKSESAAFKNIIIDYILKHMPSFESILDIWIKTFSSDLEVNNSDIDENELQIQKKDHLLAILNLLQAYNEICPEILISTSVGKKPTILLTNLCNLEGICDEELTVLKVKALKILLCSTVSVFFPKEEIFSTALSFLVTKVGDKDIALNLEVHDALRLLLSGCGVFEGCNDEIDIWIDGFTHLQTSEERLEVANWLEKIIKRISKQPEKYIYFEETVDANRIENILDELMEKNIEDVRFPMLPVSSVSLLLYGAVDNLKKSSSKVKEHYISIVLTHLLHCQVSTSVLTSLIKELDIPSKKYLLGWSKDDINSIKKPYSSECVFRVISKILLSQNEICKISTKETQLHLLLDDNELIYTLSKFEVKALLRMVVFYLTQLLQKNNELHNIEIYAKLLLSLLNIAYEIDNSESLSKDCAEWIFKHPIILQFFKGIYENNKNALENMLTMLFIQICSAFFDTKKQYLISQFMHPYQEKFVMQMKTDINRYKNSDSKEELKVHFELIEILQLNIKTIADLLFTVMILSKQKFLSLDKTKLSVWGEIVPKLVDRFNFTVNRDESDLLITINKSLLRKLFYYLLELKTLCTENIDLWEVSLTRYLLRFPHNISVIDGSMFTKLVGTKVTPATEKMLNLLVERNPKFIKLFIKFAKEFESIFQQKSLIFSMLSNSANNKWDQEFLNKLCTLYKADIVRFLTQPKVDEMCWIEESTDAVIFLIEKCFDVGSCEDICQIILSSGDKLDAVKVAHVKLYQVLFKKWGCSTTVAN